MEKMLAERIGQIAREEYPELYGSGESGLENAAILASIRRTRSKGLTEASSIAAFVLICLAAPTFFEEEPEIRDMLQNVSLSEQERVARIALLFFARGTVADD